MTSKGQEVGMANEPTRQGSLRGSILQDVLTYDELIRLLGQYYYHSKFGNQSAVQVSILERFMEEKALDELIAKYREHKKKRGRSYEPSSEAIGIVGSMLRGDATYDEAVVLMSEFVSEQKAHIALQRALAWMAKHNQLQVRVESVEEVSDADRTE